jgi:hypothetical protein
VRRGDRYTLCVIAIGLLAVLIVLVWVDVLLRLARSS